jgi:hypothetical protein
MLVLAVKMPSPWISSGRVPLSVIVATWVRESSFSTRNKVTVAPGGLRRPSFQVTVVGEPTVRVESGVVPT